jgi:hypothetical protein
MILQISTFKVLTKLYHIHLSNKYI